jgi:hypothetical protein
LAAQESTQTFRRDRYSTNWGPTALNLQATRSKSNLASSMRALFWATPPAKLIFLTKEHLLIVIETI